MTNRRSFLKTVAAGGTLVGVSGAALMSQTSCQSSGAKPQEASPLKLTLGIQEGVALGETLSEKLDFMETNGIEGFEIYGTGLDKRVNEISDALKGRNIKVGAICAGYEGWLIASDEKTRKACLDSTKIILEAAGALGSYGLIMVPAFNNQQPSLPNVEARAILVDLLKELGEFALQQKTTVILEPLLRQEAWFLRQVADAASICRDTQSAGVTCMGDFWHMTWEETSDMGAFLSAGKYLNHVHVASRKARGIPGEAEGDNYVEGFKALKMLNYQHHVSFECWSEGDRKVLFPAAVKMLKEQWSKA